MTAILTSAILMSAVMIARAEAPGYPVHTSLTDIETNFLNPQKVYGEVPFYRWIGGTLTRVHIA